MRKSQGVFVSECPDEYLPRLACPRKVKRTKGRKYMSSYLDVTATFDIETTNTDTDGFAYSWQTCIGGEVIVPRYFEDWAEMLETLVDKWGINEKNRFVLYVHNLGYEHQYIMQLLTARWGLADSLYTKSRKPLYLRFDNGIEFRDSFKLFQKSLARATEGCQLYAKPSVSVLVVSISNVAVTSR